jgi:TP901-1 family phage major tail protein
MTAQKGKDLMLKQDSDGLGAFTTMAGLRAQRIAFNAETVDVTNMESAGAWRELLAGAGVKNASLNGAGIFKDSAADEVVRGLFFNSVIRDWQVIIPDFGTVQGPFQITSLEYAGKYDGEVNYEMTLESAGQLGFAGA